MTDFYADYIRKTTFDPETNSVRSKLVEERGAPNSECCDAPLKRYNNGTGLCSDCGEHAGPVKDEQKEAATDMKKKPASKTPKVEIDPTEIPEKKEMEKEELHGDQHKLDHNKDMKITASDMKMVRKKGAVKDHPMEAEEKPAPVIIKSKKSPARLRRDAASRPMGVREDQELEEGSFKVNVEGLPTMYIDGSSAGEIKSQLRKKFKDPKAVVSIERITPAEKKKELRAKVAEDQAAMDAYLKKGGTIKKLPAAHARSTSDMEKDVKGRVDTSRFKTKGKVKSMEDVEQVDEISKRAKAAYTRVAARDLHHQGSKAAQGVANNDREAVKKADRNINNRLQGIDRATKSMQKEGVMKRIATDAEEKRRLGHDKVKGSGLDTYKKKPMGEKFANAAQQAAVMAKLKASGDYKKPKESVEEKDTHVTKDGRTAKKGLWYNIHKKRARGEAPAKPGDPDRPSAADLKRSQ